MGDEKQEGGSRSNRVPSLDGLRACSVALVIIDHLGISGAIPFRLKSVDLGNLGVRVFFVISGFIITSLLLQELRSTGSISLKQFYIRRFFRIVPIWACYVGVTLLALWRMHSFPTPLTLFGLFTYNVDYFKPAAPDLQHLWSLSVEEKFYLLWPLTLFLAGRQKAARLALAVVLIVPLIRYYGATHGSDYEELLWRFQNNADAIAVGCLLAFGCVWLENGAWRSVARRVSSLFVTLLAMAAIVLVVATADRTFIYGIAAPSILNLLIAVVIYGVVANANSYLGIFLNMHAMRSIGLWSYGIYLWQQPFTLHREMGLMGVFPFDVIALMVIAIMGYNTVEKPAQNYGRRVAASNKPRSASVGLH